MLSIFGFLHSIFILNECAVSRVYTRVDKFQRQSKEFLSETMGRTTCFCVQSYRIYALLINKLQGSLKMHQTHQPARLDTAFIRPR